MKRIPFLILFFCLVQSLSAQYMGQPGAGIGGGIIIASNQVDSVALNHASNFIYSVTITPQVMQEFSHSSKGASIGDATNITINTPGDYKMGFTISACLTNGTAVTNATISAGIYSNGTVQTSLDATRSFPSNSVFGALSADNIIYNVASGTVFSLQLFLPNTNGLATSVSFLTTNVDFYAMQIAGSAGPQGIQGTPGIGNGGITNLADDATLQFKSNLVTGVGSTVEVFNVSIPGIAAKGVLVSNQVDIGEYIVATNGTDIGTGQGNWGSPANLSNALATSAVTTGMTIHMFPDSITNSQSLWQFLNLSTKSGGVAGRTLGQKCALIGDDTLNTVIGVPTNVPSTNPFVLTTSNLIRSVSFIQPYFPGVTNGITIQGPFSGINPVGAVFDRVYLFGDEDVFISVGGSGKIYNSLIQGSWDCLLLQGQWEIYDSLVSVMIDTNDTRNNLLQGHAVAAQNGGTNDCFNTTAVCSNGLQNFAFYASGAGSVVNVHSGCRAFTGSPQAGATNADLWGVNGGWVYVWPGVTWRPANSSNYIYVADNGVLWTNSLPGNAITNLTVTTSGSLTVNGGTSATVVNGGSLVLNNTGGGGSSGTTTGLWTSLVRNYVNGTNVNAGINAGQPFLDVTGQLVMLTNAVNGGTTSFGLQTELMTTNGLAFMRNDSGVAVALAHINGALNVDGFPLGNGNSNPNYFGTNIFIRNHTGWVGQANGTNFTTVSGSYTVNRPGWSNITFATGNVFTNDYDVATIYANSTLSSAIGGAAYHAIIDITANQTNSFSLPSGVVENVIDTRSLQVMPGDICIISNSAGTAASSTLNWTKRFIQ